MIVTTMFPTQGGKNQGNRRALRVSNDRTLLTFPILISPRFVFALFRLRCRRSPLHICRCLSFTKDVSNRTDDNGDNNGMNVKKRNGVSVAHLPTQRSVTLESRDVEHSINPTNSNAVNPIFPSVNMNPVPLPQAAEMRTFMIGVNDDALSYQYSGPADDIDERDSEDPLCVTSYVQDMYEHFRLKEMSTSVRPVYMEDQQYINERMRSILVDWLVEVHLKFKLVPETLYLTVNIIDRYLSKTEVSRPKLQLVGVTALLIASKYEEIYPPELRDLVYICDRAYSKLEVRRTLLLCGWIF
jgi:hypothetical protein